MKLYFTINFHTKPTEKLQLVFDETIDGPVVLVYNDNGIWTTEMDVNHSAFSYRYQVVDETGKVVDQEHKNHLLILPKNFENFQIFDAWNNKNFPENYLNNKILKNKLQNFKAEKNSVLKKHSHLFSIEVPLYNSSWRVVLLGNTESLGAWDYQNAIPMQQTSIGKWEVGVAISETEIINYKYGIFDQSTGKMIGLESGENRWAFANSSKKKLHIIADHYFKFSAEQMYHAAGVAIPVFSLRSSRGFGVGEFVDLKSLGDWAKSTQLGIIQVLPINDTTANYTWTDSYPYAAISVYALHPQYLAIDSLAYKLPAEAEKEYEAEKVRLNKLRLIDYEKMISGKWKFIKILFSEHQKVILKDKGFSTFIIENQDWLKPYAAFCVLRDQNKTPEFNTWKSYSKYSTAKVSAFFDVQHKNYSEVMLHAWVQYQLHLQLSDAVDYLHQLGISLKGDLPIGIYRHSVEAWAEPELFGMDFQAGAPPDQFTDLGQNWGFPTYNWEEMSKNGYQWWKNRFHALEKYFDAMRIDHILGFFRIWRMPIDATQGILGYFYPAVPVLISEFEERNISFSFSRYCKPFINDEIVEKIFQKHSDVVKNQFLDRNDDQTYFFKPEFDTQRKLQQYFAHHPQSEVEEKLISLAANVLFLVENRDGVEVYHPRFNLFKTDSFAYLEEKDQASLRDLYHDYFFNRQDELWYQSAMQKLPIILNATNMLICGEDLGLVPKAVTVVMDQLGITALKVQRMPSENIPWYDPKEVSYLNVVTASSHDSSTLRQWWTEDRKLTEDYFKNQLHQFGIAPWELHPKLAEIIMLQHLYNNAMLAIFPIQEFFATDRSLVNPNVDEERINNPAVFPHYWRYRMHIDLDELKNKHNFNVKIARWVFESGRS